MIFVKTIKAGFRVLLNFFALMCVLSAAIILFDNTETYAEEAVSGNKIVILHTNDVHCSFTRGEPKNTFGLADLAAYRAKLEDEGYDTILVDAGDFTQGGSIGASSGGNNPLILINAMNYDIFVPGNHDFDYGINQFKKAMSYLTCNCLSCNFMNLKTGKRVLKAYKIIEKDGVKIGFVGVTTPQTTSIADKRFFKNARGRWIYGFCGKRNGKQLYETVQKSVDAVKKAGADVVIVVGHTGVGDYFAPWMSVQIIANMTGIDAYIDGHSHSVVNTVVPDKSGKGVVLVQTGSKLSRIGQMTIDADNGNAISTKLVKASEYKVTSNMASNEFKAYRKITDLLSTMK